MSMQDMRPHELMELPTSTEVPGQAIVLYTYR